MRVWDQKTQSPIHGPSVDSPWKAMISHHLLPKTADSQNQMPRTKPCLHDNGTRYSLSSFANNCSLPDSLMAQTVKRLPTMQETRVQSLGQEDPLEKEMATHFSTLAWKIPWTEESGKLQSMGVTESDMTEQLLSLSLSYVHETQSYQWENWFQDIK